MSENVENVTDATFKEIVVNSNIPVLVDFWAPWCGPCLTVGPILEKVAGMYKDRVKVVKVNVDDEKEIASSMGIRSIPTIALYKGGAVTETAVGAKPQEFFVDMLDKILAS